MQETPFKYLQRNMHKIKFNCEGEVKKEYQRALSAVLSRLDTYFIKNDLYKCGNYQEYVEKIISGEIDSLSFDLDNTLAKRNWIGVHRKGRNHRSIGMSPAVMFKGTVTEGVLCHEFFHHLTLGPKVLFYKKGDVRYEVTLPYYEGGIHFSGTKQMWGNGYSGYPETLSAGDALDGGFICEALTELAKQNVYDEKACYFSYRPQTQMIGFLNKLVGEKVSIENFLYGDLPHYVDKLGRENFDKFNSLCENFQAEYNNNMAMNYRENADYIEALDTIVTSITQKASTNPYTKARDLTEMCATILAENPVCQNNPTRYTKYVQSVLEQYSTIKMGTNTRSAKYCELLKSTMARIANQKAQTYHTQTSNFSIAKTDSDKIFSYGSISISFNYLQSSTATSIGYFRSNGLAINCKKTDEGLFEFTILSNKIEIEKIRVAIDLKNPNEIAISNITTGKKETFSFEKTTQINAKHIEENQNLLDNAQHIGIITKLFEDRNGERFYNVSKLKSNNGEEFLIASSKKGPKFVKIVATGGYQMMDIAATEGLPETTIKKKFTTAPKNTGMIGFYPTQYKTDEDSFVYTLADGTEFVGYYRDGKWTYGEQISPFLTGQKVIIEQPVDSLYSSTNPDLKSIFDTSTFKQEIKREPAARDVGT